MNHKTNFIDLSNSDDENDHVTILKSKPPNTPPKIGKRKRIFEVGESSNANAKAHIKSEPFTCEICTENKTSNDAFRIRGCSHSYCSECVAMYVKSKLDDNVTVIRCPERDCVLGLLEVEDCREILPKEVFDRWGNALCEAVILATEKFHYCPFKDCSALLIEDGVGEVVVKETECPNCKRMFCAECKVAWHDGIGCEEFQKLNEGEKEKEDIMLMQLAETKKWRRCPKCRFFVEKKALGCSHIRCRCGHAFCYKCGTAARGNTHLCHNCLQLPRLGQLGQLPQLGIPQLGELGELPQLGQLPQLGELGQLPQLGQLLLQLGQLPQLGLTRTTSSATWTTSTTWTSATWTTSTIMDYVDRFLRSLNRIFFIVASPPLLAGMELP